VAGDQCEFVGPHARINFEVVQIIGRRIAQVRVKKLTQAVDHTVQ
jgi:hypothetical protein